MTNILLTFLAAAVFICTQPAFSQEIEMKKKADEVVPLAGRNQEEVGTVEISYGPNGVLLTVEVRGQTEGWHGFHVHEKGDCSDHDKFQSAGAHLGKDHQHGLLGEGGPHMGDLPNIWVAETGTGRAQFFSAALKESDLKDADGSAFILHEQRDDQHPEETGHSGARIACGPIAPAKAP